MPKSKEDKQQIAKEFLDGLLLTLPEDQRGQAQEIFNQYTSAEAAAEHISSHVLRQQDYSRKMNEGQAEIQSERDKLADQLAALQQERQQVNEWWEVNREALVDYRNIKSGQPTNTKETSMSGNTKPQPSPSTLTKEELDRQLQERFNKFGEEALPVIEIYNVLGAKHMHTFNEPLGLEDWTKVRSHPKAREAGLEAAYNEVFRSRYDELRTKAEEDKLEAAREEGRKQAREEMAKQGPPYAFSGAMPSIPLDILEQPETALREAQDALDPAALAAEYRQKVQEADPNDPNWVG